MIVIIVRGTSGSGKSWVMHRIKEQFEWEGVTIPKRKGPLYYLTPDKRMALLGNYSTTCGGCDNLTKEIVQKAIGGQGCQAVNLLCNKLKKQGVKVILAEGLLLSEDVKWTKDIEGVRNLYLTTSFDKCIEQVESRRLEKAAKKNKAPKDMNRDKGFKKTKDGRVVKKPTATEKLKVRIRTIESSYLRLKEAGVPCYRASAKQAVSLIKKWIATSLEEN